MSSNPKIYCIMTTGKNDDRYKFVPISVMNFEQQTYPNKHLLIINHGDKSLKEVESDNITELRFNKTKMTLGDMRNYALNMIPVNAYWTIWDDDDWRHKRYIEMLYNAMKKNQVDVVFIKNRIDYNIRNHFAYRSRFEKGMPFVLAKKNDSIRYLAKDSLEDIRLLNDFELYGMKTMLISNDPRWYIRTIHETNTSVYVDNERTEIVHYSPESTYHEFEVTQKERDYARKIIETYFRNV
jgi:hypothetical protein